MTEGTAPLKGWCVITGRRSINPGRLNCQKTVTTSSHVDINLFIMLGEVMTVNHSDDNKHASTLYWNDSCVLGKCLE